MLACAQSSGMLPPLFFVHDQHGVMPFGRSFALGLGPDQPLYAVHANGIDGRQPPLHDIGAMVLAYMAEIHGARPIGPLLIGGLGSVRGCFVGALLLAMVQNYVNFLVPDLALVSNVAVMVAVLLWRPRGLYAAGR